MTTLRAYLFSVLFAVGVIVASTAANAATYAVHVGGTNTGLDWSTVSGAFNAAIAVAGDHTIEIQDNNGGSGYSEPRMDLPPSPLGNITITATVAVTITRDASASPDELFRNLSTDANEKTLSIIGASSAAPLTLFSDKAAAIVSCGDPIGSGNNGLLHIENVNIKKSTSAPNGFFLQIDSRALGQQYMKNVNFIDGVSTNTSDLLRAGSINPAYAQNLYMESVSFNQARGSSGMMTIYNRATIEAKSCIFQPISLNGNNMVCVRGSSSNSGLGAVGGSQVTFRDCSFKSQNNIARDAFVTLGETFQTTRNVYKFYRPQFFHCGQNMFNMADRPCEVYVLGLDDSDQATVSKVDLATVPAGVQRLAVLRGNNKIAFRYCVANTANVQSIGDNGGALVGSPTVELDHCEFKSTGRILFGGSGAFEPVVNISNCIFIPGAFALPFITTDGARTLPAHVTMTHCTYTQNNSFLGFFTANANDLYYGPGSILDGSANTFIANINLQASTSPALCWTSLGTSGFTSVPGDTVIANPQLSSTGRLTTSSTAAFGAATGSATTTDIDNDARPNPVGSDPDLGADEVSAPVSVALVDVISDTTIRVTFDGAVNSGATTATNYTLSGTGQGTFGANPDSVAAQSTTVFDLTWNAPAEMHIGGDVTITVANVLDANGFAFGTTNSATDTGGGQGVAPYVVSITADTASPTNAAQVNYSILFSENVNGFGPSECTLSAVTGTLSGASFFVTGVGDTFAATVNRGTGDVSFRLDVPANPSIIDYAGNPMTSAFTSGDVYAIQELHIVQDLPGSHLVTAGDHVSLTVTTTGGVSPKTYVWYYAADSGGPYTVLADQTTGTLDISPVEVADEGYYYLTVSDANESVDSATMHLVVDDGIPVAGLVGMCVAAVALCIGGTRAARRE